MGGPIIEGRFAGMGTDWKTPPFVPAILEWHGFEPDLYVCDRQQRLATMTVDCERKYHPVVIGDMNHLPFRDRSFRCGFYDPPYNVPYQHAVNELLRVCREKAAILHIRDVAPGYGWGKAREPNDWKRYASILLLCGNDSQVRCLNLFLHNLGPADIQKALPSKKVIE